MKYLYSGPASGATLQVGEESREVMLHPGKEVELPEENEYTKTLLALKYLAPVPQQKQAKASPRIAVDALAVKGA